MKKLKNLKELFKDEKMKRKIMLGVSVFVLLVMVSGAAYAFFSAQMGGGTGTSINATTGTTDSLSFSVGKDIEIKADMDNFKEGMESRHGETTATASLKANNTTNGATARYNVFFIIDSNNFEYSTEDGQTELLLKVTDPNGNEVENITGLKRVEGGFDITTRTGGFLIAADYDIEATPSENLKSQTWKLEVTFVNLDVEQNINKGKTLNGRFYITKEQENTYEIAEINNIEATPSSNSITASLTSLPGTSEIAKYYYAIEEDTSSMAFISAGISVARLSNSLAIKDSDFIESDEPTHTFNNLKPSTAYKVYSYAKDIYGIKSNVYETSITTEEYELAIVNNVSHSVTLNSITVTATATPGENEISKYYFSKDNGVTWSEGQDSNVYTFTDLLDTTEYKIKVKVIDTNNVYSAEYYKAISTETYINPSVTTVNATKTYNSIDLTTTAAGGTNNVSKYYYKVGNGTWSEAQTLNTYHISSLEDNTTYTIYVKVDDTNGRMSNEYSLDVTTNEYELPSVTASVTAAKRSLTITASGTNGDGTIVKYMYSKDDGSNWKESNSNSYTFDTLTQGTKFYLAIKAVDNNGRESSVYKTTGTTLEADISITTTYNGAAGAPSTVGAIANLSCTGATSTYNQKYNRVEISQVSSQTAKCTLGYTSRTSKTYLNNKIISLAGTTQGTGQVVHEIYIEGDYTNATTLSQSQYVSNSTYSSSSSTSTSGTNVTNAFTYNSNEWVSNPANMTSNKYYHFTFNVPENGSYQICYTMETGSTNNRLYAYNGTNSIRINGSSYLSASSSTEVSGCDDLGYVTTTDSVRVVQRAYTSISTVKFSIKKGTSKQYDTGYRYEGENPNNYVWFNNELWRIIGVFDSSSHGQSGKNLVKIIRATPIGGLSWDKSGTSNWSTSSLKALLNGAYYNQQDGTESGYCYGGVNGSSKITKNCDYRTIGIDNKYRKMIINTTWYLGGHTTSETANTMYKYERDATKKHDDNPASDTGYIGLMYASDYGYASLASNCSRTTNIGSYNTAKCAGGNWLYGVGVEWTIASHSEYNRSFFIQYNGGISVYDGGGVVFSPGPSRGYVVRPVLYLDTSVYTTTGDGSVSNPYVIGM